MGPATIYLNERRGVLTDQGMRMYCTFNFKQFSQPYRDQLAELHFFNDVSVEPGALELYSAEKRTLSVVLPVTGTLSIDGEKIEVEEISWKVLAAGQVTTIKNTDEPAVIEYLHLGFIVDDDRQIIISGGKQQFDFFSARNRLQQVGPKKSCFLITLGLFDPRQQVDYTLKLGSKLFAFVISGSFEINGRLLNYRDGLVLSDTSTVEIEAFSKDAIVMLIEL